MPLSSDEAHEIEKVRKKKGKFLTKLCIAELRFLLPLSPSLEINLLLKKDGIRSKERENTLEFDFVHKGGEHFDSFISVTRHAVEREEKCHQRR